MGTTTHQDPASEKVGPKSAAIVSVDPAHQEVTLNNNRDGGILPNLGFIWRAPRTCSTSFFSSGRSHLHSPAPVNSACSAQRSRSRWSELRVPGGRQAASKGKRRDGVCWDGSANVRWQDVWYPIGTAMGL